MTDELTALINEFSQRAAALRLSETQFAAAVGVGQKKIAQLRHDGLIQYRQDGRDIYYLPTDVAAYHAAMLVVPRRRHAKK